MKLYSDDSSCHYTIPICGGRQIFSRFVELWQLSIWVSSEHFWNVPVLLQLFCLLVLISITLFTVLFFPSQGVPCLISLIVVYWAKHFHRWSPWATAQPHRPWSNYSKRERTFLLVCEGTFPWLPSSPGVEAPSAQLLLQPETAREGNYALLSLGESQYITSPDFLTYFKTQKIPQIIFTSTCSIWLNMWGVIFPRSLTIAALTEIL